MAKKNSLAKKRETIEELLDGTTGTKNRNLNRRLINQATAALWIPEGTSEEEKIERFSAVVTLLKGIKPTDEIEGLLATQMVATHDAAMECLRRAMLPQQSVAGIEQSLKHGEKLMSLYARQMEALNKHRGKGQQKVVVEHVHVEAGAQAVVGDIHAAPQSDGPPSTTRAALTHAPGKTLEMKTKTPVPVSRRSK